ncbi:ash family protein [Escherichia coli]|nr:ash family protein [Escherichia coli]MBO9247689.1 ash family protein [Escherichia coli]
MLTVQKKIFSLAGMSPKSSNMTAKSGINTADTSKVYHFLVVGADALTMSEITVDSVSVEKVGGCAREFLVVDGFLCSRSDSTKTFVHTRDVNEMSAMYCASGASNSEFSESIKKSLPLCGNTVYGYKAPHKTGAGIGVLVNRMATYDAPSVFFYVVGLTHPFFGRWCIIQRLCQSMVAQAGASSEAPVSIRAGYANPVWATTSEIGVSGGSVTCYRMEAATCWLLPLPKNRNLSGLSQQFAAICRQLPPKFTISPQRLSRKPAAFWRGITFAFLPDVFAQGAHMLNYFRVAGCATARSGELVEFVYIVDARSAISAKAEALNQARNERLSHIQITRIREVAA